MSFAQILQKTSRMETEFRRKIFNGIIEPSDKSIFISIPMNMYRVQTSSFSCGLNFFEKAVLKLKYMPHLDNSKIAEILHLDEKLINQIVNQLITKKLLTTLGNALTHEGERLRNESDGFILDESKTQIGYIFTYDSGHEIFPYYQKDITFCETSGRSENKLIFNTDKGLSSNDIQYSILGSMDSNLQPPTEEKIVQVIKNTFYQNKSDFENKELNEKFKIKFLPDEHPESVDVFTYIYLQQDGNNVYSDDWFVKDPFNIQIDNNELKIYLNRERKCNSSFNEIFSIFKDAVTENNLKFEQSEQWFEERIQEKISELFDKSLFNQIDSNIRESIHDVIAYYMRMERKDFKSITHNQEQNFFINMQGAIESILIKDQNDRALAYEELDLRYENADVNERRQCLRAVYLKRYLSETTFVPTILFNTKTTNWKGRSLLDYLMKFIMSLTMEENPKSCKLISVFKNRIDEIINIAGMRNCVGHGTTEEKSKRHDFSGEDAIKYFSFFSDLINDYLKVLE